MAGGYGLQDHNSSCICIKLLPNQLSQTLRHSNSQSSVISIVLSGTGVSLVLVALLLLEHYFTLECGGGQSTRGNVFCFNNYLIEL